MNANKSSANSFTTFLETVTTPKVVSRGDTAAARSAVPIELLKTLATSGSKPVQHLMMDFNNIGIVEFAETLNRIEKAGLISLKGSGSQQVAELTPTGETLAKI